MTNTHEEALKEIKRLFCFGNDTECAFYLNKLGKCNNCALNTAKEALEKQIPKKPQNTRRFLIGTSAGAIKNCICCGHEVFEKFAFCPNCGQRQDWSEEE